MTLHSIFMFHPRNLHPLICHIHMCVYLCIVLVVVCGLRLCFLFKIYLLWSRRGELRCVLWHMILVKLNSHSYKKVLCRKYAINDVIQKQKIKIICLFVFCNWIFKICYLWIIQTEFLFWVSADFIFCVENTFLIYTIFFAEHLTFLQLAFYHV